MESRELNLSALRLARELKVWADLQHPHILPLLGFYLDKDYKVAILMSEYMADGDLKDYIELHKPDWGTRLRLVRDLTDGLAYLHGRNPPVRHGDLKVGNVLINLEHRGILADFSLSKALGEGPSGLTTSEGIKGTLRYYSPEMILDADKAESLPSDMWAWGCLVMEVLTNQMAYADKTTETSIILALMNGEVPADVSTLPNSAQAVKDLLACCWTIQPEKRPLARQCLSVLDTELVGLDSETARTVVPPRSHVAPRATGQETSISPVSNNSLPLLGAQKMQEPSDNECSDSEDDERFWNMQSMFPVEFPPRAEKVGHESSGESQESLGQRADFRRPTSAITNVTGDRSTSSGRLTAVQTNSSPIIHPWNGANQLPADSAGVVKPRPGWLALRPTQEDRLARELKVWAALQHPHVLPLLGYYLDQDYKIAILLSEYMIKGDLRDYMEQENPSWDLRLQIVRDSVDGLAYLHTRRPAIRHGDLKTGNVLINAQHRAMLADFGLSKALEEGPTGLTTSEGLRGTLRYYSPELLDESNTGPELPSDIWAWACLTLELLVNILPYANKKSEQAVILALLAGQAPCDTESLPIPVPEIKSILTACWAISPSERPSASHCLSVLNSLSMSSNTTKALDK
ncbi:hypothetical protein FRB90_001855 [Tulasnella sp. 427]|nr:hypothetical protein FRB90_001855 [Tulasnella sp. 427]